MTISSNDPTMMSSAIMASDSIDTITLTGTSGSPTYTISSPGNVSGGLYWGLNGTSANPGQVLTSNGTNTSWSNITLAEPDIKGARGKIMAMQGKDVTKPPPQVNVPKPSTPSNVNKTEHFSAF